MCVSVCMSVYMHRSGLDSWQIDLLFPVSSVTQSGSDPITQSKGSGL